jgi:hypothetical protein
MCGTADPQTSDIGEPCASANDCTQACLTVKAGGYCSSVCSISKQGCPEGSACVGIFKGGGDFGACLKHCEANIDCRAGYDCVDDESGGKVCR